MGNNLKEKVVKLSDATVTIKKTVKMSPTPPPPPPPPPPKEK